MKRWYLAWCTGIGWWYRPVCDWEGARCDLLPLPGSATSQLLVFLTRWPGTKRAFPLQNRLRFTLRAHVCVSACASANLSNLTVFHKGTRSPAALSQPSATVAPRCCAYAGNGMWRPFPLNVSTGCCSHTAPPRRLIMNDWLINRDY